MENLLDLLPMGGRERNQMRSHMASGGADQMKGFVKRNEAIIRSMTPGERRNPDIIKASRRQRIARGSGTTVTDVNDLLRQFDQARKMARQFGRMQKRLQWMR
jgi:signal recognition particle subunit SRP54